MAQNEFSFSWNGVNKVYFGTAAPTSGTYVKGDICLNSAPAAAASLGWICVTSGTPGTWKAVGAIDGPYTLGTLVSTVATLSTGTVTTLTSTVATLTSASIPTLDFGRTVATIAAPAVLTVGAGLQLYTGIAGTCTLAAVASHAAGFEMTVKNIAAVNLTLATVAGAEYDDAAAVTLTQHQVVTLVGDGTTWYKKA